MLFKNNNPSLICINTFFVGIRYDNANLFLLYSIWNTVMNQKNMHDVQKIEKYLYKMYCLEIRLVTTFTMDYYLINWSKTAF
jgi:hypothetical protein